MKSQALVCAGRAEGNPLKLCLRGSKPSVRTATTTTTADELLNGLGQHTPAQGLSDGPVDVAVIK